MPQYIDKGVFLVATPDLRNHAALAHTTVDHRDVITIEKEMTPDEND